MSDLNYSLFLILANCGLLLFALIYMVLRPTFGAFGILFCLYNLLFFAAPAYFQVKALRFPFFGLSYSEDLIRLASEVSLVFSLSFLVGFFFRWYINIAPVSVARHEWAADKAALYSGGLVSVQALLIVYILVQLIGIIYIGWDSLVVRRGDSVAADWSDSRHVATLASSLLRALSFVALLLGLFLLRLRTLLEYFLLLSLLCVFLIVNYPLALPRFQLFSYVLAILFAMSSVSTAFKALLVAAMFIGVVTVFPLMSELTRGSGDWQWDWASYYTKSGDFDGFQSLLNVLLLVEGSGFGFGRQFLGALLVFVPRVFWPGKPEPTGLTAAEFAGYDFTNISAPLAAELYVDFGLIGIIFGGFFIGLVFRKCEAWLQFARINLDARAWLSGAIAFSFLIILQRGSLMGVLAPIYSEFVILYASFWMISRRRLG